MSERLKEHDWTATRGTVLRAEGRVEQTLGAPTLHVERLEVLVEAGPGIVS